MQSWVIDWDDGTVQTVRGTSQNLTHVNTTAGDYQIGLTAIDQDGTTKANKPLRVSDVAPDLTLNQLAGIKEGQTATLSGTIDSPAMNNTYTLSLNWGDGDTQKVTLTQGATLFSVGHVYLDNPPMQPTGSYTITATATPTAADQIGTDSASATATVEVAGRQFYGSRREGRTLGRGDQLG